MHTKRQIARRFVIAFLILMAIAFSDSRVRATVILPNLPPGTQYELIFVTLDTNDGASSDIATYNSFVSNEASLSPAIAALGAQWHAVASTATTNAIVNAPDNGIPVYNTQGIQIATARDRAIQWEHSQPGAIQSVRQLRDDDCLDRSDKLGWHGSGGHAGQRRQCRWSFRLIYVWLDFPRRSVLRKSSAFVCASSPITVPEPSSLVLLAAGAAGLFAACRRRRHKVT